MEKIDIYQHRGSKNDNPIDNINYQFIGDLLLKKGLTKKQFGLCSEPWTMYFEESHCNERGTSSAYGPINNIWVTLHNNKTYKTKVFFYNIRIYLNKGFYYLECFAQTSRRINTTGAQHTCYKVNVDNLETELPIILDEIYLFV